MLLTVEVHRHHCAWRILSCLGRPAQWHPSIEHLAAWSHSLVMCSLSLVKQEEGPTFIEQQPKTQHSVLEHAEIPWHVLRAEGGFEIHTLRSKQRIHLAWPARAHATLQNTQCDRAVPHNPSQTHARATLVLYCILYTVHCS